MNVTLARFLWLIGLMALTSACTTGKAPSSFGNLAPPEGNAAVEPALGPGEKIAIISSTQTSEMAGFLSCLGVIMRKASPALQIIPDKVFRDELFPWFEPGTAPSTDDAMAALLQQSLIRERIAALGVRYVVAVSGYSDLANAQVGGDRTSLLISGEARSGLSAQVLDLARARSSGTISANAAGPAGVGILLLIPVAYGPDAENKVCNDVGWRLAQHFSGGTLIKP